MYKKPELNPFLFYGPILSYQFIGDITKDREKYRIRLSLKYGNGETYQYQKSGFVKKKDAEKYKDQIIHDLVDGTFCPFNFSLKDLAYYWLYIECVEKNKIACSTFDSYRNIIDNYLFNRFKDDIKIKQIDIKQLERFLKKFAGKSLRRNATKVITGIFSFAYSMHYIDFNPAPIAVKNINTLYPIASKKRNIVWSLGQIKYALWACKENFPELYMLFLLSLMLGTRISETIAIKYSDIDYTNNSLLITRQLGYYIDLESSKKRKGEIIPKTVNGIREIPVPDWVIDEIIVARAKYEKNKSRIEHFQDNDYICCHIDGTPYHRSSMNRDFKKLLAYCGYEDIHWHDLRHIYSTMLERNNVNIKAVSMFLGHKSADFTKEVYIANKEPAAQDCTYVEKVWTFVKPKNVKGTSYEISIPENFNFPL